MKMQTLNLKNQIFIFCFLLPTLVFATEDALHPVQVKVVTRKKNGSAHLSTQSITILGDHFENQDFKIMLAKSDEALSFSDPKLDETLKLKAANVLFHLNRIKQYFINTVHSETVKNLETLGVRLELTNQNSKTGKFANDAYEPQYNNALSIPAGKGYPKGNIPPWNREIWFRPIKKIPVHELLSAQKEDPLNPLFREIRKVLYPMELQTSIDNAMSTEFSSDHPNWDAFFQSEIRQAGTLLMIEGSFQVMKVINRALIPQFYFIDTAMVPEIITHEFSHIAMSDYIEPNHPTPVIEGYADYFAASLDHSPKLAAKIKKYNTALSKNGTHQHSFDIHDESHRMATSDYVLSLLWGIRKVLGESTTTKLIYESRKYIHTQNTDIRTGLIYALITACDAICKAPETDRVRLYHYFESRGL